MTCHLGNGLIRLCVMLLAAATAAGCGSDPDAADNVEPVQPLNLPGLVIRDLCDTSGFKEKVQQAMADPRLRDQPRLMNVDDLAQAEMHDCQRLIIKDSLVTRAALLVSLDSVAGANFDAGAVIAQIDAYDGDYPHLDIQHGPNCLWLRRQAPDQWTAAVRPANGANGCADSKYPSDPTSTLTVRPHTLAQPVVPVPGHPAASPYPSSGRWMWDKEAGRQFIGIRCGETWCEIGPSGFTSQTSLTNSALSVPGWGDEQLLSYKPPAGQLPQTGLQIDLSDMLGRIDPVIPPGGIEPGEPDFVPGRIVATLSLGPTTSPARQVYEQKFKFSGHAAGPIELVLRKSGSDWQLTGDPSAAQAVRNGVPISPAVQWRRILRQGHNHSGPRSVRWAWSETDEETWVSCVRGCCMTQE